MDENWFDHLNIFNIWQQGSGIQKAAYRVWQKGKTCLCYSALLMLIVSYDYHLAGREVAGSQLWEVCSSFSPSVLP